ncbi:hypothetical protein ACPCUV_00920 [Streptomyces platensis]|uniref:hypothetical protein n=1 Tax=Streptomyces platensis TaxID=58346 RepID=UPI003C2D5EFF
MIDPQSVKADALAGTDSRGFDGGSLVNSRKRHRHHHTPRLAPVDQPAHPPVVAHLSASAPI